MADRRVDEVRGIRCRSCGCGHFKVIYTRPRRDGTVMRRKECRHCGRRLVTWEKAVGCARVGR